MSDALLEEARDALIRAGGEVGDPAKSAGGCPALLFHYTDVAGLTAMLTSQNLRLSLATALNDASEVEYGIEVATGVLASGWVPGHMKPRFLEYIARYLDPRNSPPRFSIQYWPYVFSFCARVDRSAHWLHYGRLGAGVAMGFDSAALRGLYLDVVPVIYRRDEQENLVKALIERIALEFTSWFPKMANESEQQALAFLAAHLTATNIRLLAVRMKPPSFDSEEEWRLVLYDAYPPPSGAPVGPAPMFRVSHDRIVPYLDLRVHPLPIAKVVLGASCRMRDNDSALRLLFERNNGGLIPGIETSQVLVRP